MGNYIFLLVLVLAGVSADSGERCNSCQPSTQGCNICFSNCTNLIFKSCQDNSGPLEETDCIQSCCDESQTATRFDADSLTRCLQTKQKPATWIRSAAYYAILGAGSLALLVLLIIIIRAIYRRAQFSNRRHPNRNDRRSIENSFDHPSLNVIQPQELVNSRSYPVNCKQMMDDSTNSCCICLDTNVNSITKCGHVFHLKCLRQWEDRKNSCPLCNYKDIHEAKLFCKVCKNELDTINFLKLRMNQVQNLNNKLCQNCSNS